MLPEPPQNGEYLIAAYVIAAVILVGYWVALWRRAGKLLPRKSVSGERTT
jgi:hypothetical protein